MFKSTKREVTEMIEKYTVKKYICETCGCFIAPEFAVAGEKEIRQRKRWISNYDYINEDYIYTPYYCKVCAPKVKK